jgi:hypothetical protein
MSLQPDLDIRNRPHRGIQLILKGLLVILVGVLFWARHGDNVCALPLPLAGVGLLLYGVIRLVDRTAKVSLTVEGLKDHRSGIFIRWRNIRGVRVSAPERSYDGTLHVLVVTAPDERMPYRRVAHKLRICIGQLAPAPFVS